MKRQRFAAGLAALVLMLGSAVPSLACKSTTLRSGMRGDAVRDMQTALIRLGYLGGTADGIFGTNTENAVKKFQRANKLTADGLAGTGTLDVLYRKAGTASSGSSAQSSSDSSARNTASSSDSSSGSGSSSSLFGGNYTTLRKGDSGARVTALQKRLISLGYLKGSADGKYGAMTQQAVQTFQKANRLTADGLAGKKTLTALEQSSASAASAPAADPSSSSSPSSGTKASGPSGSQVSLLHWYDDVKPNLKNGQTLYIYEPSSGQGWNLRVYSRGRHCDAEPRTAEDTANLLKAFGGNTWEQKAVYVRLPSGVWTIGATHSMPHESGSVKDNHFNGHLCVHFLRTMSEAEKYDPKYGVSNQKTIRAFWKSLTGETITK